MPGYNMAQHWPATTAALRLVWGDWRRPVVVHCAAGVSRSVSTVIAFLLVYVRRVRKADVESASPEEGAAEECRAAAPTLEPPTTAELLFVIQAKRPQANPNEGFRKQLIAWRKQQMATSV